MDSLKFRLQLQSQGLNAKLYPYEARLYILVESKEIPAKEHAVKLVRQALQSSSWLSADYRVYIYGRSSSNFLPDWVQAFSCRVTQSGIEFANPNFYCNQTFPILHQKHCQKSICLPSPGQKLNPQYRRLLESVA
ncbi:MAG: hypothetical protein AAF215_18095 [Cyanobacteria bacterium P01_A01_bin.123]